MSIDTVEVLRCRACEYYHDSMCKRYAYPCSPEDYCSKGMRKLDSKRIITIGENIKRLRTQRGISRLEMATALGIDSRALAKYEDGVCEPRATRIIWIASYFGVTTDEILLGEDV